MASNSIKKSQSSSSADNRIAIWTAVVGVFTILLFLTSAFSDYVIFEELSGNQTSDEQSREERRAYLSLGQINQAPAAIDKEGKSSVAFYALWQNLGGTRTKWANGWVSIQYFPNQVAYNFDITRPSEKLGGDPVRSVVGPNGFLITAPVGISHDEAVQAAAGKGVLLVWGAIKYADIFDPDTVRHGTFCYKLVPGITVSKLTPTAVPTLYQSVPYQNYCNTTE